MGCSSSHRFRLGGIVGTAASDIAHAIFGDSRLAYLSVFIFQAMLFMASALVAYRMRSNTKPVDAVRRPHPIQWREGSAT